MESSSITSDHERNNSATIYNGAFMASTLVIVMSSATNEQELNIARKYQVQVITMSRAAIDDGCVQYYQESQTCQ